MQALNKGDRFGVSAGQGQSLKKNRYKNAGAGSRFLSVTPNHFRFTRQPVNFYMSRLLNALMSQPVNLLTR